MHAPRFALAAALSLPVLLVGCAGLRPAEPAVAVGVFQDVAEDGMVHLDFTEGSTEFLLEVPVAGRYRCELTVHAAQPGAVAWVEDYLDNDDGRTYDITMLRAQRGLMDVFARTTAHLVADKAYSGLRHDIDQGFGGEPGHRL